MIHLAITLDDVGEGQWVYCIQYMNRKETVAVEKPIEEMTVNEKKSLFQHMLGLMFYLEENNWIYNPNGEYDDDDDYQGEFALV